MGPITFVRLQRADFPLLAKWLSEPTVARWWDHETSPEALERDFGPEIDGAEPSEVFLAWTEGRPFGLIQRYKIADYPEYVEELSADLRAAPRRGEHRLPHRRAATAAAAGSARR